MISKELQRGLGKLLSQIRSLHDCVLVSEPCDSWDALAHCNQQLDRIARILNQPAPRVALPDMSKQQKPTVKLPTFAGACK